MGQDLIRLREQVMDRADRALDAAWPARIGDDYVREMQWAASELENIAAKMQAANFDRVEQCRSYRFLGSVYADLEPALGKEMLHKAKQAYQIAENLLQDQSDELERAKLNFNFGNTLRQIDPNDIELLRKARQHLQAARAYFAIHDPRYLPQADAALQSVESLINIAPLSTAVQENLNDMAALQKKLEAGADVSEIAEKSQEVMKRGGGAAGMVGQLQTIIDTLPDDLKQNEKFAEIQKQMQDLTRQALAGKEMEPEVKQVWSLLNRRLKSDIDSGAVSKDRADSLSGILEEFGRILSGDENDVHALLNKLQDMRTYIENKFEMAHYLSHGIERPPEGSRAADLVELNWQLRRYLLEEMNRPEKGEKESKETLELNVRAARVDRRIYEAGADNGQAMTVEKEELRQLALAVRNYSARNNTMIARPVWRYANVSVDTNAVFYSGAVKGKQSIAAACRRSGLKDMAEPKGESYASGRWKQLQNAITAVFDLRVTNGPGMAAATYELGIALTLGKPVVILVAENQILPFDVDIPPVVLAGGPQDNAAIATAIDQSVVWTYPMPRADGSSETLDYILSLYQRPHKNTYVDQTLRMLADLRKSPDPLAVTRTLIKLFDYLKDGKTMLIRPYWPPVYPSGEELRVFHVMPFHPTWANDVSRQAEAAVQAQGGRYVRGDAVADPDVIQSIWNEIACATHVLVDLTDFNPNVALELGIAHTLGREVLLLSQGKPIDYVFPAIAKLRVKSYDAQRLDETLGRAVEGFIASSAVNMNA